MKKPFCDICGKPAINGLLTTTILLEDMRWGSTMPTSHGFAIPKIVMNLSLEATEFRGVKENSTPDICGSCLAGFLSTFKDRIVGVDPLPS